MRPRFLILAFLLATGCGKSQSDGADLDASANGDGSGDAYVGDSLGPDPADCGVPIDMSGTLDVDIARVHVAGRVTMGGAALPAGQAPLLRLLNSSSFEGGPMLDLARVRSDGGTYDLYVAPGTYDVLYDYAACTSTLYPCQQGGHIKQVSLTSDGVLDLDIPVVRVSGRITIDGAALPASSYSRGQIGLRGADGSIAKLADLDQAGTGASYQAPLLSGTYDVLYGNASSGCTGSPYPCQQGAVLSRGITIGTGGTLDVDVRTARIGGRVTLNGGALVSSSYSRGSITVRGADGGDGHLVGLDAIAATGSYDVRLVVGTYDLLYDNPSSGCTGTPYPCQHAAVLRRGISALTSGTLDLDVPTVRVSGRLTLDGGPLSAASYSRGSILLRGADGGSGRLASLDDASATGGYDVRLIPGTYDLLYDNPSSNCTGAPYPCQQKALLRAALVATTTGTVDVDVRSVRVQGRLTLTGGDLPAASYSRGSIELRGADGSTGRLASLDDVAATSNFDVRMIPGTYDLLYSNLSSNCTGVPYPCQQNASVRTGVSLITSGSLDLDLRPLSVSGRITLGHMALPTASYPRGDIAVRGTQGSTGRLVRLDDAPQGTYDTQIFPGRYNIRYETSSGTCSGTPYPCQTALLLGCLP